MLKYPARIERAEEGGYVVDFIDLPGCVTEGETMEEALDMAKEALTGWLKSAYGRGLKIPDASAIKKKNIYYISPEPEIAIPILIRKLRMEKGLSQKQVADAIGIRYQTYQRFENPNTFNATIRNLNRISKVFGRELDVELI